MTPFLGLQGAIRNLLTRTDAVVPAFVWGVCLQMMCAQPVHSQTLPDAGSILREAERQPLRIPPTLAPRAPSAKPPPRPEGEVLFKVQRFKLEGVKLIPEEQVQKVLNSYLNREIAFSDLELAMAEVAAVYEQAGWLARVQVPEQDLVDGVVALQVIEGRLGQIRVAEGSSPRLSEERVQRTMTARQQRGQPLNLRHMERGVSVLSDTPGVTVTAALANGEKDGETDIVITVGDRDLVSGSLMADNSGSLSTGPQRGMVNLSLDNALAWGEQFGLSLMGSAGTRYAMASGSMPWGYDGWRVGAAASVLQYQLVGSFAASEAQGSAATVGLRAQYPLWRTTSTNINTAFTLDAKDFNNDAKGANVSRKSAVVMAATLSGDRTDELFGGGYLLWSTALSAGRLDLSRNASNEAADLAGPRTEGSYAKLSATLSRLQTLSKETTLWLSLSGQISAKNLDSSEKFPLGGSSFVRGYPTSEGTGDQGWLSTLELRHTLSVEWQFAGFVDYGQVWLNRDASHVAASSTVPNHYALSSAGLGVSFNPSPKAALRLAVSHRLSNNPGANPQTGADSDGTLQRTRAWLSASWYF